ncbi:MAG: glycosyltransferase [Bacteroidales bacterium]|nr:glycosyltransferase [Bacteroidales bacterium]
MNTLFLLFTPFEWCAIALVFTLFIIITLYQLMIYRQPAYRKNRAPRQEDASLPSVSVALCVTNEYKVLRRVLPILLTQDYPTYEVVVINDRSEDNSEILLRVLKEQYPHLQVRTTSTDDRFGRSPSLALGMAIRAAQYDTILCIEADCQIKDANWIRSMAAPFGGEAEIVLGHTTYRKSSVWVRCNLLQHALHYLGRAAIRRPYTGTGSNLLFKKSLFYDNNGFNVRLTRDHFPLRVFIGEVANKNNCRICTLPSGVTHSHMKLSGHLRRQYRKMEKRSLAISPQGVRRPMLMESVFRLFFYLSVCSAIIMFHNRLELLIFFGTLLLLRPLSVLMLYVGVRRKLDDKGLAIPFVCWDFVFPFINIFRIFF